MQLWLTQFDRAELSDEEAAATVIAEYEKQIAGLERKVGQLTIGPDLVKKTPCQSIAVDSGNYCIALVTGLLHPTGQNDRSRSLRNS